MIFNGLSLLYFGHAMFLSWYCMLYYITDRTCWSMAHHSWSTKTKDKTKTVRLRLRQYRVQWNLPEWRAPTKIPIGSSVSQIAISETSRKRPPPVSDHLNLTSRVVTYGRFHCIYFLNQPGCSWSCWSLSLRRVHRLVSGYTLSLSVEAS